MFWTEKEAKRYIVENGFPTKPKPHVVKKMSIASKLLKGSTVLDVGCGEGHLYPFIKDQIEKYVGLDASQEMLKIAESFFPEATWFRGDVYRLKEQIDKFDTVYSISLLIHLYEQDKAIEQLWSRAERRCVFLVPIGKDDKIINVKHGLIYHQTTLKKLYKIIGSLPKVKHYSIKPLSDLKPRIKFRLGILPSNVRLHYFIVIDRIRSK